MRQAAWAIMAAMILPPLLAAGQGAQDEIQKLLRHGKELINAGKDAEALPHLTRAMARAERELGKDHDLTGQVANWLGHAYSTLGQNTQAESFLRRSISILEARRGKDHPTVVNCIDCLAVLYHNTGQYAKAEPLYIRCLEFREAKLGKDSLEVATTLNSLAILYFSMGQYTRAEAHYIRSLAIRKAKLGKDHPDVSQSLNNLATLYQTLGQFARAETLYRRSLELAEAKLGKGHPDVATSLNNLAGLYSKMMQFGKAEPLFQRSLAIREAKLGKDHLKVATSLNNLGVLYHRMGQYAKSEPLYLRSLAIQEAKLGKNHPELTHTLISLAVFYHVTGEYAKAEPMYRHTLTIQETNLGRDHPELSDPLLGLAGMYAKTRDYAKADPLCRRSLAILEAKLGKDHPEVAGPLIHLGNLHELMGRAEKAEPLYRRSLAICEAKLSHDHPNVAQSLNHLGKVLEVLGRTDEASGLIDRARRSARSYVSVVLPMLPPAEQANFLAAAETDDLHAAVSLALAHRKDASLTERSASWLLNGKAVAEEALARSALLVRDSRDPAIGKLASQFLECRAELARRSLASPPRGQEKEHRGRVAALLQQEQQLARRLQATGATSAAAWLDLSTLRERLPTDGVFIDVARFEQYDFQESAEPRWKPARYAAWVTRAKGDVILIDLGEAAAIDSAVADMRKAMEESVKLIRPKGEAEAEKALRGPLEKLSKLVLGPLLPHAGEVKRWVVSPDGNLWLVPWEILLLPDGKYTLEKHVISYVVSGRDFVVESAFKGKPTRPLVVADPDFDLGTKAEGATRVRRVQRLPGTRGEAKAISQSLADYVKQPALQYLGEEAQEGAVKAAKNPRVLVLSTHGFFRTTERVKHLEAVGGSGEKAAPPGWKNPLLRCGLLLAGCNVAARSSDDGVLTGLEVIGMDLRGCELVVLSACETGLGDVQNGEGVAGLRQAFRLAGAEAVVSTLWQVPDKQSARLMTLFFQALAKGKGRAEALREAQLKVIEERREDAAAAHPFYWAAFTLTGR